jgi:uncharacterized protein (TIGR03083 family)
MPTLVDKDLTVRLLRREFDAIAQLCEGFDEQDWDTPTCLPGWSVKDNLSHIVGTELMLDGEQAPDVDISHLAHVKNDIAKFNELWVESMRPLPGAEVLARFRDVAERRLATLEAMSQEEFDAEGFTPAGPDTHGRFMRIRHFDCFLHEHDMREALGLEDRPDAEQLELVLDEVSTGLGYVVGKKAGAPAGSTVRVRVTGPATRDLDVEVAERAHLVEKLDGAPTAQVTLPAMVFLRLSGGRRDAGDHLGADIELAGDEDLARRVATSLAFTI